MLLPDCKSAKKNFQRLPIDKEKEFEVQCTKLCTNKWIKIWTSSETLMISIPDGRKLHFHWKSIRYIRKIHYLWLSIVFLEENMNIRIKFHTKFNRNCFIQACREIGRISKKKFINQFYTKYKILKELPATAKTIENKEEQRAILNRFLKDNFNN